VVHDPRALLLLLAALLALMLQRTIRDDGAVRKFPHDHQAGRAAINLLYRNVWAYFTQ
jgi:hypothetical protein